MDPDRKKGISPDVALAGWLSPCSLLSDAVLRLEHAPAVAAAGCSPGYQRPPVLLASSGQPVHVEETSLTVVDSTVTGNYIAAEDEGSDSLGGGIFVEAANFTVSNSKNFR